MLMYMACNELVGQRVQMIHETLPAYEGDKVNANLRTERCHLNEKEFAMTTVKCSDRLTVSRPARKSLQCYGRSISMVVAAGEMFRWAIHHQIPPHFGSMIVMLRSTKFRTSKIDVAIIAYHRRRH